jgi:hypothetical protein
MVGQNLITARQPSTVMSAPRVPSAVQQPSSGSGDRQQTIVGKTQQPQPSPVVTQAPSKPVSKPVVKDPFPWLMENDDDKDTKPVVSQISSKPSVPKVVVRLFSLVDCPFEGSRVSGQFHASKDLRWNLFLAIVRHLLFYIWIVK